MKILHVSPSYMPAHQFGGPIQSVHLLNKYLVRLGHEVDVVTTNAKLDSNIYNAKRWHNIDNVRVKYFSFWGYIHYNFSFSILFYLLKNTKKYDIVHITAVWNFPVWAAYIACKIHKVPYVISPRGTIYKETINLKSAYLKKIYYRFIAKQCLANAAAIHYTSMDEQIKVGQYLKLNNSSFVIANGIELVEPQSNIDTGKNLPKPYFLFLGRLSKKKGIDLLIPAFSIFSKKFKNYSLLIVGPDEEEYKSQLETMVEKLNMNQKIIFKDMVLEDEKNYLYQNAAAFVLCSYSENFGMTVIEAIINNCPTIISNKVAIQEKLKDEESSLICNTDIDSVADAMIKMEDGRINKEKLSQNALKVLCENFDIKHIASNMAIEYRKIIEHSYYQT
jgi:glycosyltransferase involved in cell wall biosynthesis